MISAVHCTYTTFPPQAPLEPLEVDFDQHQARMPQPTVLPSERSQHEQARGSEVGCYVCRASRGCSRAETLTMACSPSLAKNATHRQQNLSAARLTSSPEALSQSGVGSKTDEDWRTCILTLNLVEPPAE
jgi:hypothetical protein